MSLPTAHPTRLQLRQLNQHYLQLQRAINQERSCFRYPARLIEEAKETRNQIIELQSQLHQEQEDREYQISV